MVTSTSTLGGTSPLVGRAFVYPEVPPMFKQRNPITKRISIRTSPTSVVEVWETAKREIFELHRKDGQLDDVVTVSDLSFEQCVRKHMTAGNAKALVTRQALDEGRFAFMSSAALAA